MVRKRPHIRGFVEFCPDFTSPLQEPVHERIDYYKSELSTGRMDPRVGSGRVGSGRIGSGHDFAGFRRVGSGRVSTSGF